ncbi:MAG: exosortase/archaeosortase family protein [Planctomycetota bacterium]
MSTVSTGRLKVSPQQAGDPLARLMTPPVIAAAVVFVLAFALMFWQVLDRQREISTGQFEDWGHAFIVPFISGFLVWKSRDQLAKVEMRTFWPALPVVLLSIIIYFQSVVLIRSHFPQGAAMLLGLYGSTLLLLGPRAMRHLFLPLAYLSFAITLPESIMLRITFQLQFLASQGAWVMLSVCGLLLDFETELNGNTLKILTADGRELPLNVAEACSGMRMVVAFYALAAGFALGSCRLWWQRATLILLAAPVAVLMNMARVAVLGLVSLVNPDLAAGNAHMVIGTILLFPSIALFFGVVWALNKFVSFDDEQEAAS